MSPTEICNLVKIGDVKNALRLIQACPDSSDLYVILVKLNSICYKNIPELSSPGVARDVFNLADLLCRTISNTGVEFPKIVHPLYHITNYLLKFDPLLARDICKYFFQVDASRERRKTGIKTEEQAVNCNLLHIFSNKLLDRFDRLEISSGKDSVESWLEFTFQLSRLRANDALKKIFQVLHTVLIKCSGNRLNECLTLCFSKLEKWLVESAHLKEGNTDSVVESFSGLVQLVVSLVPDVKNLVIHVKPMVDCIAKIQAWSPEGTMVILESVLLLCQALENEKGAATQSTANYQLNRLTSAIIKQPDKLKPVLSIVLTLIYKSRHNFIASKDSFKSDVKDIFPLLLALSEHISYSDDAMLKKSKKHLELVYTAFAILNGVSASKKTLELVFADVKKFVKLFCKTAASADKKSSHFSAGVAELLNVMNAYKRAELTVESAQICQYMYTVFSEMDPNFLSEDPYFKNYIEVWLKSWATSCVKNTYGIAAQVMLIIFAQRYPKFTIDAMKAWASLKKSKVIEVNMHATVLDVLNVNKQEIEQNNPSLKVEDFDIGRLLLGEAYAYSKSRDLYGEPVLNVYKAAAKATKRNYIALANILCCTVDAFTFDVNDKKHFATLDASVLNMIAHLHKVERDIELPSERAALFCSLGNLFYYKARLERQRIRQKAEAEVSEEKSDLKIPVIRLGEKDALDVTEIVAVGSSLKRSNSKLLEILEKAMECWAKCANSLEPSTLLTPTLSAIKGAGYLFRLYGYKELESSCWNQLFRIASKLGSAKHQFLAAGELLVVRKTVDPPIINCVEKLKFDRKSYACLIYQVNVAKNMLFQGKVDECRLAIDKIDTQSLLPFFLANAQHKILLALFNLSHPAGLKTDKSPLAMLTLLFENLMYLIINNQWETHNEATVVQLLVLETAQILSRINSDLKYVRPARCYLKCGLPLSKKLALPARVCQVMTLGCWVDLLTWNVTESEINAQEVESLLELGVLKLGNRETVCSPRRDSGLRVVPHFLSKKDCKCQSCLVTDYPFLVLDAISNRVLVLIGNDGHREAHQVIDVGMKVLEFIKENEAATHTLSSSLSCSIARFYYVVASANALWLKHEEALRYVMVAARALDSAPMKNVGLDISIKRLTLGVRWTQSHKRPVKPKPISRRFASGASIPTAVTPEGIPFKNARTVVLNNPKHAEKGYYDVSESEKFARKSLYSKEATKEGCGIDELEGISKLSVSPVPTFAKKIGKPTKTYGTNLNVPNATNTLENENFGKSNTPETRVSDVPIFANKLERPSKQQPKTHLFFKGINNHLDADESQTPDRSDKAAFYTPPNPANVEASSARKPQTVKKPIVPKANMLGTPCMASLAKIGLGAKTPAIKVYYDPDGLESTTKKQKSKVTIKKSKRLVTKGSTLDKLGTPKATRTLAAKDKITLDEDFNDEIELVSSQFKRLLAHKERSSEEETFKKPAATSKNSHAEEEKASTQMSECPLSSDNQDDTGSTESFHSTLTHFDDTLDSLPSMKNPQFQSNSKKSSEANTVAKKDDSESSDSYFSLCSDDPLGNLSSVKKPLTYSSRRELALQAKSRKLAVAVALDEKNRDGPGSVSQAGEKYEAADDFDSSGVVAAPFRKVITKMAKTARPIVQETITDLTDEESDLPQREATPRKHVAENSTEPCTSRNPRLAILEEADELESSEVITAATKTRKARRAIFDDTADIHETECLAEAATISGKHAISKAADPKTSKSRKPRRAVVEEPQNVETGEVESLKCPTHPAQLKIRKPRRAIFNETTDVDDSEPSEEVVSPFRKVVGHSAPRSKQLFDETTVDFTNETGCGEIATVASVELGTPIDVANSISGKSGEASHVIFKVADDERDPDATVVASPFRKLAKLGQSGLVSRAKPVIQDETLDEEEIQECKQIKPGTSKVFTIRKTKKIILNETFDKETELPPVEGETPEIGKNNRGCLNKTFDKKDEIAPKGAASALVKTAKATETFNEEEEDKKKQNPETTHTCAQKKETVGSSLVKTSNRSKARVLKSAAPAVAEEDELADKKNVTVENTKKPPDSNVQPVATKVPAKAAPKSTRRLQGVELEKFPSTSSRATKSSTARAVSAGSSKEVEKPARRVTRAVPKETKPGLSKQPVERVKSAKGLTFKAPSSDVTVDSSDCGNSLPPTRVKSTILVDGGGQSASKAVSPGSGKAVSLPASPRAARYVGARPKRGAAAAPKEPQTGGLKPPAKTAKSAKTQLTVPSSNLTRKSPNHENLDPTTTDNSPSLIDSSIIESSFLEPSTEMKLPLAPRSLAEEMNKLSISSEPAKQPDKTNTVKPTRRNVRK